MIGNSHRERSTLQQRRPSCSRLPQQVQRQEQFGKGIKANWKKRKEGRKSLNLRAGVLLRSENSPDQSLNQALGTVVDLPPLTCQNMEPREPLWLVDSGALRSAFSPKAWNTYRGLRERIFQGCTLEVFFPTAIQYDDREKQKIIRYETRAVIGPVENNLLSVNSIARMRGPFTYGPDGCSIRVSELKLNLRICPMASSSEEEGSFEGQRC